MTPTEAAEIIDAMSSAIRDNPAQFHISISQIGQQITSHGGTGLSINAVGGGAGSTTIGQTVSAGGGNFQIT